VNGGSIWGGRGKESPDTNLREERVRWTKKGKEERGLVYTETPWEIKKIGGTSGSHGVRKRLGKVSSWRFKEGKTFRRVKVRNPDIMTGGIN